MRRRQGEHSVIEPAGLRYDKLVRRHYGEPESAIEGASMTRLTKLSFMLSVALAALAASSAHAQDAAAPEPQAPAEQATPTEAPAPAEAPAINEDEMADLLNSQQQIKQDVTLTRSVNGQVVETKTETVIYSKDDPIRGSEAEPTALEKLKARFDGEALTRKEALEEAKLGFVVGDLDRDDAMTAEEFVYLVKVWDGADTAEEDAETIADPVSLLDQEDAGHISGELARAKFAAMAGSDLTIGKRAFTRKIIEDFENNDLDKDDLLRGDELLNFRKAVRGKPTHAE
ncbi:MAG: hypothetical protein A3E78_03015 [Alphaproteobacteria bacterium RIFCSPHIGHO2_12_FULL_63_12]|nr:MAG: hypothetical protein A3E78_03015 [Alphaproteobacteria bacterium RIFCSPHIGHO2_12_FULL_63_12]